KLEQWRDKIAFEFRDNTNYWKKERESMKEDDFLKYKREYEARFGVPTAPYKNEINKSYLISIEYI
ncbi:4468_t:CDS:1, partial [Paraglomus occultum]